MDSARTEMYRSQCPKCEGMAIQSLEELEKTLSQGRPLVFKCSCGDGDNQYFYWPASPAEAGNVRLRLGLV